MLVDLHCHSTCSDGSLAPAELADLAQQRGIGLFCLTDHDSCAGWPALSAAWPDGPLVRGLELSCGDGQQTIHLLVYDVARDQARWQRLDQRLDDIATKRRHRVHEICARLFARGIAIDPAAILRAAGNGAVGRPHVARALVEIGAVRSVQDAFARYLHDGGPADVPMDRLPVEEAVALALDAGGHASLAHPHLLGERAVALCARLAPLGLGGLEVFYAQYGAGDRRRWQAVARAHGLVATAGSDYHGADLPQVTRLGVEVPEGEAAALRDWLGVANG